MKIQYNLNDKYMKYYNEAKGINLLKNKLKKNPDIKIKSYMFYITLRFPLYFILFFLLGMICIGMGLEDLSELLIYLDTSILIVYIFMILSFLITVFNKKINSREGILEISEEGILDKTKSGIQLGFSYKQIELIVITDNLIVFLTNVPVMIIINNVNSKKNKIINKIKQNSDIQIIDKTNN